MSYVLLVLLSTASLAFQVRIEDGDIKELASSKKVHVLSDDLAARERVIREIQKKETGLEIANSVDADFVMEVTTNGRTHGTFNETERTAVLEVWKRLSPDAAGRTGKRYVYSSKKEFTIVGRPPEVSATRGFLKALAKSRKS